MQIYPHIQPIDAPWGTAVAMGFFDGLHIGHRAVIEAAVQWARQNDAEAGLFTFSLPRENDLKGGRLLSTEDKHAAAEAMGICHYTAPAFAEIRSQSPEEFVQGLVCAMNARALFCGENFTFGAKAAGNVQLLRRLCAPLGVQVVVVPLTRYEGKPVSSTRIRKALEGGDIPAVNAMLGQPYSIDFPVQHGKGLGHRLGVPTLNQCFPQGYQLPRQGIYITRVNIDGVWHPGATGLGSRPTVNTDETLITCETFVPGFSGDLYGTSPRVEFYAYLCPSKKFDTLEQLRACIDNAAQSAVRYFGGA